MNHNANYSSMPSPDMDPADRRQPEQARRPLSVATDNMMLEFYKKDGYEPVSLCQRWGGRGGRGGGLSPARIAGIRLHSLQWYRRFVANKLSPPPLCLLWTVVTESLSLLPWL